MSWYRSYCQESGLYSTSPSGGFALYSGSPPTSPRSPSAAIGAAACAPAPRAHAGALPGQPCSQHEPPQPLHGPKQHQQQPAAEQPPCAALAPPPGDTPGALTAVYEAAWERGRLAAAAPSAAAKPAAAGGLGRSAGPADGSSSGGGGGSQQAAARAAAAGAACIPAARRPQEAAGSPEPQSTQPRCGSTASVGAGAAAGAAAVPGSAAAAAAAAVAADAASHAHPDPSHGAQRPAAAPHSEACGGGNGGAQQQQQQQGGAAGSGQDPLLHWTECWAGPGLRRRPAASGADSSGGSGSSSACKASAPAKQRQHTPEPPKQQQQQQEQQEPQAQPQAAEVQRRPQQAPEPHPQPQPQAPPEQLQVHQPLQLQLPPPLPPQRLPVALPDVAHLRANVPRSPRSPRAAPGGSSGASPGSPRPLPLAPHHAGAPLPPPSNAPANASTSSSSDGGLSFGSLGTCQGALPHPPSHGAGGSSMLLPPLRCRPPAAGSSSGSSGSFSEVQPHPGAAVPASPTASTSAPLLQRSGSSGSLGSGSSLQLVRLGSSAAPPPRTPSSSVAARTARPVLRMRQPPSRPLHWWLCGGLAVAAAAGGAVAAVYGVMTYLLKVSMVYSLAWKAATGVAAAEGLAIGGWSCKSVRTEQAAAAQSAAELARVRAQAEKELATMRALLQQKDATHSHEVTSLAALNERLNKLASSLRAENSGLQGALDRAAAERKCLEAAAALESSRAEASAIVGLTTAACRRVAGEVEQLARGQQQLVGLVHELREDLLALVARQEGGGGDGGAIAAAAAAAAARLSGVAAAAERAASAPCALEEVTGGLSLPSPPSTSAARGPGGKPLRLLELLPEVELGGEARRGAALCAAVADLGDGQEASSTTPSADPVAPGDASCSSSDACSDASVAGGAGRGDEAAAAAVAAGDAGPALVRVKSVRGGVNAALAATISGTLEL